jgi:hypothetical protein
MWKRRGDGFSGVLKVEVFGLLRALLRRGTGKTI